MADIICYNHAILLVMTCHNSNDSAYSMPTMWIRLKGNARLWRTDILWKLYLIWPVLCSCYNDLVALDKIICQINLMLCCQCLGLNQDAVSWGLIWCGNASCLIVEVVCGSGHDRASLSPPLLLRFQMNSARIKDSALIFSNHPVPTVTLIYLSLTL